MRHLIFMLMSLAPLAARAQEGSALQIAHPQVQVDGTELRTLHSAIVDQEYIIKIRLPEGYDSGGRAYPVLYLMDGDHAFAMATDIVQYLEYGEHVPELIIVSPAYGSKHSPENGGTNMRGRDLYPAVRADQPGEPGAVNYLRFLEEELIPYIDANFRTLPADRTFSGYSLGSSFGWYVLFTRPTLFQRYVLVDGLGRMFLEVERNFAARRSVLPVTLFTSSGIETEERTEEFADVLRSRNYEGFTLEYARLSGIDHFAVPAEGLTRGLRSVFSAAPSM